MGQPPMPQPRQQSLHARTSAILRRLVRRDAAAGVRKVLAKTRPVDVAAAMEHLTWSEQQRLFMLIEDPDTAAEVLAALAPESVPAVTSSLSEAQIVDLVERMDPDDATDVVEFLADDVRARVVGMLRGTDTEEVSVLLAWPSDSAGGIMSPAAFRMPETASCGDAIQALQERHEDLESVFYLYVVDQLGRLTGVVSLRTLLVHPHSTPLISVMNRDVITVGPRQDQEEVARFVARYDLLAVPVVDEERRLLGIVTVDDVVDVIREEVVEDMMRLAGVNEDFNPGTRSVLRQARQRAGWLLATSLGGVLAAELIGYFEDAMVAVAVLGGFIPVIMGMGGNVGIQSATIAVRGLATGHVQVGGTFAFVFREARVGLLLGVLYGGLLGGYGVVRYWTTQPLIGVSVGTSMVISITLASLFGSGTPVILSRLGVDPAVSSGPFVTTVVDLVAIFVYFNVAILLLGL